MSITPDQLRDALAHISPALPRDQWARVAMSVKSEFADETGFDLFDQWSQGDAEGYDPRATRSTWRSVRASGGVRLGTVIQMAKEGGWRLPVDSAPAADAATQSRQAARRREQEIVERTKRAAEQDAAADRAAELWEAASEAGAPEHAYLRRKSVAAHGVRVGADGCLLVPLRNAEGELRSLQFIAPERPQGDAPDKLFLKGGATAGLFHLLGSLTGTDVVLVAEGYATAASLHEATGLPVACAFNAGNLPAVAKALRKLMGGSALIVVAGDDDRATELRSGKNPGTDAARRASRLVHGACVFPSGLQGGATDFNDLHQQRGLDVVRQQVEASITQYRAERPMAKRAAPSPAPAPATGHAPGKRRDPFSVSDSGVYYVGRDKDGNELSPQWLCGRLEVTALTRDADGQSWGYLLSFADPTGRAREWAMPARMLATDGAELRAALLGMGLSVTTNPQGRNRVTEYLQTRAPEALAVCAERTGWHPTADGGAAYVLPRVTIGDAAERIVYQSEAPVENTFRQRGDLAAWQARIGSLCVGNSRLVFAVACAFAGPLMRPAGVDTGGVHFRADSSSGKTTALRVAASVNGGANYLQRWRATANSLEAVASAHCDSLLVLDELSQVDGREAGEAVFLLGNETGKSRMSRGAALRPRLTWRLLFLSSGEVTLNDHMSEAQRRTRAGQETRLVNLDADAGAGMGVFEDLHGREGGAALAHELQRATATTYGAPGLAWLEWLAPRWSTLAKLLRERTDALRAAWVPEGASGQAERVAARFALVAVAGELATEAGLTGWPAGESERAARKC